MKVPATLLMLLASQTAAADFAARVAAGRAAPPSPAAREYYVSVMSNTVVPILRGCAPPGTITAAQDWVLTLVGTLSPQGRIEDIEVDPVNSITTCVVERMRNARSLAPAAGVTGDSGLPLLFEVKMTNGAKSRPPNIGVVKPVFSQVVAFSLPAGFVAAFENATATNYIQELVPQGESVEQWSQMITMSGARDQALNTAATPINFAGQIAQQFQSACPDTFSTKPLGASKVNGHEAFVALLGCGAVRSGTPRSEVALIIAITGKSDMYTIQWAERAAPINKAPDLDGAIWNTRFRQLDPVRVCSPAPGDVAPYPSCIGGTSP
ncbi:MAG: hypothetical protein ABI645_05755 [Pseudomonadota bacterium]